MFLTIHKIKSRLDRLSAMRYCHKQSLFPMCAYDDKRTRDEVVCFPPDQGDSFVIAQDDFVVGRDRYFWAESTLHIPQALDGFDSVLVFDFGYTDPGFTHGFESLLHINGKPVQGVDSYHNEVVLAEHMQDIKLQLLFWSGLEGGGVHTKQVMRAKTADFCYLHRDTESLYYIMSEAVKLYSMLPEENPIKIKLLAAMNSAILGVDLYSDIDTFYPQATQCLTTFKASLAAIESCCDFTVSCIGHSHIDLGWLWRIKHTKEKGQRSFSTVLKLMEQYPFLQSQPQLYEFIRDNFPETYQRIKARVAEGHFEVNGGMWVEADCNLISGESMVRQFLYGDKFLREEFGKSSDCLWLPDVFGYSHAMPQILKQCNIKTFMTTKISWNEYNKIPHDTFFWRGIDGSEVLTHFITTPTTDNPDHYSYFTYNGILDCDTVCGAWKNYKDKSVSNDIAICFGYGDGGGGPTKDMLERMRAIQCLPAVPQVKTSTASAFFEQLHNNVTETKEYVHTFADELYFENHRGTYTSQAHIKRSNRKCEFALQRTEAIAAFAALFDAQVDKDALDKAWKLLLLNQFHDIIPGSSITEVYQDSQVDHRLIAELATQIQQNQLSTILCPTDNKYSFYNMSGFEREEQIFIPETRFGTFHDGNGSLLPTQKHANGYYVQVTAKALGFTTVAFHESVLPDNRSPFTVDNRTIYTPYFRAEFSPSGELTSLFDIENNREALGRFGNRLTVFEDISIQFDAWNLDIDHLQKQEVIDNLVSFEVIEAGALQLRVELAYRYHSSQITQSIIFYSNSRRIDFVTTANWHQKHKFLKALFDVNVFSGKATYDIQFGNVERNNHFSTSWDWAKFEVCAHKWMDISESNYGVALLNDCKYGHSAKDSIIAISLIKCSDWPDTSADEGNHSFTYSLLPHSGTWRQADVQQQAEMLNTPLEAIAGEILNASLFKISNTNISVDTVKLAEAGDEVILRLHEYKGGTEDFTIESDFDILSIEKTNLLETERSSGSVTNTIKPYEIQTYSIKLAPKATQKGHGLKHETA